MRTPLSSPHLHRHLRLATRDVTRRRDRSPVTRDTRSGIRDRGYVIALGGGGGDKDGEVLDEEHAAGTLEARNTARATRDQGCVTRYRGYVTRSTGVRDQGYQGYVIRGT